MSPKPYLASHLGSVASAYTDLRLSGEVKEALVERTLRELDLLVPQMERSTLELDPERKTLGDVDRTRLNYNRTRELMLDRLTDLESVSSSAVVTAIDHLERMIMRGLDQRGLRRRRIRTDEHHQVASSPRSIEGTGSWLHNGPNARAILGGSLGAVARGLQRRRAHGPIGPQVGSDVRRDACER